MLVSGGPIRDTEVTRLLSSSLQREGSLNYVSCQADKTSGSSCACGNGDNSSGGMLRPLCIPSIAVFFRGTTLGYSRSFSGILQ